MTDLAQNLTTKLRKITGGGYLNYDLNYNEGITISKIVKGVYKVEAAE